MTSTRVALSYLAVAVVVGCSASQGAATDTSGQSPTAKTSDTTKPVSFESYESATFEMVDCLRAKGFELNFLELDPQLRLYDYEVPLAAVDDGSFDSCYVKHLEDIDRAWQRHQSELDGAIDPNLVPVNNCLRSLGVIAEDEEPSGAELVELLEREGINPSNCEPSG